MDTTPRSGASVSDWILIPLVPIALMHPTFVAFVASPSFMALQWDRQEGIWWAAMNASLSLSYAAWMCRWMLAHRVVPLIRVLAVVLLIPGLVTALSTLRTAITQIQSTPQGPNHGSNADVRIMVFAWAIAALTVAVSVIVLDRRKQSRTSPVDTD